MEDQHFFKKKLKNTKIPQPPSPKKKRTFPKKTRLISRADNK